MKRGIRLISLNIERSKHLQLVIPFLKKEKADIVCLQEVMKKDVPRLAKELKMHALFEPMTTMPDGTASQRKSLMGIAMLSPHRFHYRHQQYYYGSRKRICSYDGSDTSVNRVFLWASLIIAGRRYTIGTTHFTWTPDGNMNAKQQRDLRALLRITGPIPHIVFCGDFNASRGGVIFKTLAEHYVDHIPKRYRQSLDSSLHRNKRLKRMVDGLFSTLHYRTTDVRLLNGVSDHRAIHATISLTS